MIYNLEITGIAIDVETDAMIYGLKNGLRGSLGHPFDANNEIFVINQRDKETEKKYFIYVPSTTKVNPRAENELTLSSAMPVGFGEVYRYFNSNAKYLKPETALSNIVPVSRPIESTTFEKISDNMASTIIKVNFHFGFGTSFTTSNTHESEAPTEITQTKSGRN